VCSFHDTVDRKGKKLLPWTLASPRHVIEVPWLEANRPRCSKCGEPKEGFHLKGIPRKPINGCRYPTEALDFLTPEIDVFKTKGWFGGSVEDQFKSTNYWRKKYGDPLLPWSHWGVEPPSHAERWTRRMLSRDLYFSVRLEQLFKRAKVKGQMVRSLDFKDIKPSPEDEAWIEEKLKLLAVEGLVDAPKATAGKTAGTAQKWFKAYLKKNAKKGIKAVDFAIVETKRNLTLPQDYKGFISKVGPKSFKNVEGMEETITTVLPPHKLDFKNHRRGKVDFLVGEDAEVDGVAFAEMDNGDCFVFDVSVKDSDYPVFWFKHEESLLEPFAPNFAECIKRFAQKN
jgi:hypothetical protein